MLLHHSSFRLDTLLRILCLLSAMLLANGAAAQTRTIVVSTGAGGPNDNIARALASDPAVSAALGHVVINNVTGNGGLTAVDFMRSAPADGSVILLAFIVDTPATQPLRSALQDFVPLALVGTSTSANGLKSSYAAFGPPGMSQQTASGIERALLAAMNGAAFAGKVANIFMFSLGGDGAGGNAGARMVAQMLAQGQASTATQATAAQQIAGRASTTQSGADDPKVAGRVFRP